MVVLSFGLDPSPPVVVVVLPEAEEPPAVVEVDEVPDEPGAVVGLEEPVPDVEPDAPEVVVVDDPPDEPFFFDAPAWLPGDVVVVVPVPVAGAVLDVPRSLRAASSSCWAAATSFW